MGKTFYCNTQYLKYYRSIIVIFNILNVFLAVMLYFNMWRTKMLKIYCKRMAVAKVLYLVCNKFGTYYIEVVHFSNELIDI